MGQSKKNSLNLASAEDTDQDFGSTAVSSLDYFTPTEPPSENRRDPESQLTIKTGTGLIYNESLSGGKLFKCSFS